MAVKLKLKKRDTNPVVTFPLLQLQELIESGNSVALMEFFTEAAKRNVREFVHDKAWLELLVNWVPEGGLPMTDVAKWFKLTAKVNDLDDTKEGTITLSDYQAGLIWGRLKNEKFRITRISSQFIAFIMDFQEASGKHFEDEEPDKE